MSTNIEWTHGLKNLYGIPCRGETWNPTVGCSECSAGCLNCYAAKMAWRIVHMGRKSAIDYEGTVKKLDNGRVVWTGKVNLLEHRLLNVVKNRVPTAYFVDSMSDLFHESIPFDFIDKVFAIMLLCPQHVFQVLTKRTDIAAKYINRISDGDYVDEAAQSIVMEYPHLFHIIENKKAAKESGLPLHITNELLPHLKRAYWGYSTTYSDYGKEVDLIFEGDFPPQHIWIGTSIEDQHNADKRREPLKKISESGWLTWISNEPCIGPIDWTGFEFIKWMVTGGESGSEARPINPSWAGAARDFCKQHNIPFFFKQWGMNKHSTGRILDGITHDAYPVIS